MVHLSCALSLHLIGGIDGGPLAQQEPDHLEVPVLRGRDEGGVSLLLAAPQRARARARPP